MPNKIGREIEKCRVLQTALAWLVVLASFLWVAAGPARAADMPDADRIKADLIGRHIINGRMKWRFDSISEFEEFDIKSKRINGLFLEYKISVILKPETGDMGAADLVVVYKREQAGWRFVTVTDNRTLRPIPRKQEGEVFNFAL